MRNVHVVICVGIIVSLLPLACGSGDPTLSSGDPQGQQTVTQGAGHSSSAARTVIIDGGSYGDGAQR
jgi:hypothetical protein